MRAGVFRARVTAHGVRIPRGIADTGGGLHFYGSIFGFEDIGSGFRREYSDLQVRHVVAWIKWLAVTGRANHKAIRLMSESEGGWVVASAVAVEWVEEPSPQVFQNGEVVACVPVPEWLFGLDGRA